MQHIQKQNYGISKKENEIISLLLQFKENLLTPSLAKKVKRKIDDCPECKEVYDEIEFFFNDQENLIYELMNPNEINYSREKLMNFAASQYHPNHALMNNIDSISSSKNQIDPFAEDGDCFCCGS